MTGTDLCVNKPHKSRSYLNHHIYTDVCIAININHTENGFEQNLHVVLMALYFKFSAVYFTMGLDVK
jgi:hypothetical protein